MKHLLPLLSLLTFPLSAQQYTLSGKAPKGVKTIYLYNAEATRGSAPDSVKVAADGTFRFTGDAKGRLFGTLAANRKTLPVVLSGNTSVDFEKETLAGNEENEGLSIWKKRFDKAMEPIGALQQEYNSYRENGKQVPDSVHERINRSYDEAMKEAIITVRQCCLENPKKLFPAILLQMVGGQMDHTDLISIVDAKPAFMETSIMSGIKRNAEGWRRQLPGTPLTDITLPDSTGTPRKLSEFVKEGRYTLIDFWASWCGPCRREMPHVKAAYDKYHAKGFDIVGLSLDQDKAAWLASVKKLELAWPQLSDLKGWKSIAASTYGINSIPATILIGPDGKVAASNLRGEQLEKKLAEIFK